MRKSILILMIMVGIVLAVQIYSAVVEEVSAFSTGTKQGDVSEYMPEKEPGVAATPGFIISESAFILV